MAYDVLDVAISIVASESTFSTKWRVLEAFRSSLTPKMVQALICTQDWLKRQITHGVEEDIEEIEKLEEGTCFFKIGFLNKIV